ncbi:class I SAM-dependent methyltransferase [Salinirubellus salinus]|jgi:ubiquinone/menaquinone biosynthesis C-methylase UbiE|uniref:Class I SAM-dependent methyltransferase n=1 Tax=Salinirubellus salinus TaxID=1364945 RepID=A0A9E7R6H0_9EURY|nr:class I SAM-dependent methyltransferase [Salinirubellus salinus]UWM56351.1 class I SAM-dependent methyltransferase [Salinirubellus salinus]
MGFHTFDAGHAERLEDEGRYRYVSVDELLALFDPSEDDVVADFGSGTGFYTDDVAPYVDTVHAVDVQEEMHAFYREKGAPDNVAFVTAEVADLPFDDDALDGAFTTMTFHEFATEESMAEVARVLAPGARFGVADWSANGRGEAGPPRDERYALADAEAMAEAAGLVVEHGSERRETFVASLRAE